MAFELYTRDPGLLIIIIIIIVIRLNCIPGHCPVGIAQCALPSGQSSNHMLMEQLRITHGDESYDCRGA